MLLPYFLPLLIFAVIVCVNFFYYLIYGRQLPGLTLIRIIEVWTICLVPAFFLTFADLDQQNDCCTDSALFSPAHRIGIYILIFLCTAAYFYSSYRKHIAPPVIEVLTNCFLMVGVVLNVLICIHLNPQELGAALWLFGNIPIIMLFILKLSHNQKILSDYLQKEISLSDNVFTKISLKILQANPFIKFPVLLIIGLPVILLLTLLLFAFGQKPDTLIRAFTDTYKHGFSQLDYMCDNVECGGHFLCSVGANGHRTIVKPVRYGERNGSKIICNRQLLISNAFEELVQEKTPAVHKFIRRNYNKVGNLIHKHYHVFKNKIISDIVYLLMKPLELVFLLILYTFDKKPEDRIAKQYLTKNDKEKINSTQH